MIESSCEKISIKGKPLRGIDINMNNMPDAVQTLAVTSLFAKGETRISGIGNLRIKETDRVSALKEELSKLGARVEAGKDFLKIYPGTYSPSDIETYDDHRMAMSMALAGLKIPGVRIKNPSCVEKSFPDFFDRLKSLYE
jgi:3-phosphoshikimate 1-carboxyvinyltransferase